jgi:Myb/SANT-like DNA-binding domain
MKLKNLKAQTKKVKLEDTTIVERLDDCQDSEHDTSIETKPLGQKVTRKRSKVWKVEETDLLKELVEKYCHCLDTSQTRESLELRISAWETITEEFNRSKDNSTHRDMSELKIKLKNMKAKRSSFKTESESGQSFVEQSYIEVEPIPEEHVKSTRSKVSVSSAILHNETTPASSQRTSMPAPAPRYPQRVKAYEVILDGLDPTNDYSDEDDVS